MNIIYTYKTEKEYNKEKALREAETDLHEVINKARINKNVQKWLNNEDITNIEVEIRNAKIFVDDYRFYYHFNNKVTGYIIRCGGNSLDYFKVSFSKKYK